MRLILKPCSGPTSQYSKLSSAVPASVILQSQLVHGREPEASWSATLEAHSFSSIHHFPTGRKAAAVCERLAKSPVVNENASSSPDVSNDACRSLCTNTDACSDVKNTLCVGGCGVAEKPSVRRLLPPLTRSPAVDDMQVMFKALATAISVGGGNTFLLLKRMYDAGIVSAIKKRVLGGVPYLGVSAGSNVAAVNICTTNDMPIIQPLKLEGIGLLPFNINVHFENRGDCAASRRNESRVDRLRDYLELYEGAPPIVCIRDGSALYVEGTTLGYVGVSCGKLFQRGEDEPMDLPVGTDLSFLLKNRTSHCTRMCLS
ncbi:unnamed protein product [Notodromas monacha]|uniref:Alpha-aspartyl dipeptidase n=1 Tax=Notodromas monacha TaxID=399045 RepID=A0A7R9BPU2_9CRUS|nr:unnamed protein product [Notodromas monacha]CAG0919471.1 unnamed protein product [Notodromas monacha]